MRNITESWTKSPTKIGQSCSCKTYWNFSQGADVAAAAASTGSSNHLAHVWVSPACFIFFPTKDLLRGLSSLILSWEKERPGGCIALIWIPLPHPARAPACLVPPLQQPCYFAAQEHSLCGGLEAETLGEATNTVAVTEASSCHAVSVILTNMTLTFRNYFCLRS